MHPLSGHYWVCETHDERPWSGDKACATSVFSGLASGVCRSCMATPFDAPNQAASRCVGQLVMAPPFALAAQHQCGALARKTAIAISSISTQASRPALLTSAAYA